MLGNNISLGYRDFVSLLKKISLLGLVNNDEPYRMM